MLVWEDQSTRRKTCPGVTLSSVDLMWSGLESKSGLCSEGRLLYSLAMARSIITAVDLDVVRTVFLYFLINIFSY